MSNPYIILGIGNLLMTDDGIGVHAVRALNAGPAWGTEAVDVGTDFLTAVEFLAGARRALVIDAVRGDLEAHLLSKDRQRMKQRHRIGAAAHRRNHQGVGELVHLNQKFALSS